MRRLAWPFRECVGDRCVDRTETVLNRSTSRNAVMTSEPIRPALLQSIQAIEAEAATEILRMLTSDRVEPTLRCHADGADGVVN